MELSSDSSQLAIFPETVLQLSEHFQKSPARICTDLGQHTLENTKQYYIKIERDA